MTGPEIDCLLYRGAGVAPTDSADDPVSVGRNTRARTHIVELLARARTRERTHAVVAGIWLYVHGICQFCWGLQVFVKKRPSVAPDGLDRFVYMAVIVGRRRFRLHAQFAIRM